MRKKITTLYIDDTSIRLLVSEGKTVKKSAHLLLEPGLIEGGVVMNETEVVTRIKKLFSDNKVRDGKVILGLSGMHCFTRPITLPLVPKTMLPEAIMRVAAGTLPLSLDQLYVMWHALPSPPDKTQVFLAAMRRKSADSIVGTVRRAGLRPYLMDIKPLALARLVRGFTAIIIDVQANEFDIVVMVNGISQPIRTIPFPREMLTWEQKFPLVKDDVERTIQFYNSNNAEKPLSSGVPVFVSGELANQPELCEQLARELGFTISVLTPKLDSGQADIGYYMVNIGLVLKEPSLAKNAGPSVANVNFLPVPYRPKPVPLIKVVALPATIVIAALLVPMVVLLQGASADMASVRDELDSTQKVIAQKQKEKLELNNSIDALKKKISDVQVSSDKFAAALSSLELKHDVIDGDLMLAMSAQPGALTLTRINHTGDRLTVNGRASSETEIFSYAGNLEASGHFSEITIASMNRAETGIDFSIILKVRI